MKKLINERSGKLFKKLFENQGIDTGKYENYSLDEDVHTLQENNTPADLTNSINAKPKRWKLVKDAMELGVEGNLEAEDYPQFTGWTKEDFQYVIQNTQMARAMAGV